MTTFTSDIDRLFADELDAIAAEKDYVSAAQQMLENEFIYTPPKPYRRQRLGRQVFWAAAAAVVLALGTSFYFYLRPQEITAHLKGTDRAVVRGSWIASAEQKEMALYFSDGSMVSMDENTELRVQELKKKGAHLLLERGTIDVSVVHKGSKEWTFDAGPYRVHVTGTRFDVLWVPEDQTFKLDLKEGSVKVEGPMIEEGKVLNKGNRIRVSLLDRVAEISKLPNRHISEPVEETTDIEALVDEGHLEKKSEHPKTRRVSSWRVLAKKGHFDNAVAMLKPADFARIRQKGSAKDLMLLGDATRLAGRNRMALEAYKTVRKRFPKTSDSQRAAFLLGRLSLDRQKNPDEAAKWFSICYRENRNGIMAREAAGRLIEALEQAGNMKRARHTAMEYMNRFPSGPHKKLAQKILSQTAQ